MERKLIQLFDFQRIAKNTKLESIIASTQMRYGIAADEFALSDDDLEIFAAGDLNANKDKSTKDEKDE